jgi:conserved oligomeric Golgi complex subunit 7
VVTHKQKDNTQQNDMRRYLSELEMKVQLAAEDVEQQLFESSSLILSRVTSASSELARLRSDLLGIGESVDTLASQVTADERSCSVAASKLKQLDLVKRRVLDAASTLQVRYSKQLLTVQVAASL